MKGVGASRGCGTAVRRVTYLALLASLLVVGAVSASAASAPRYRVPLGIEYRSGVHHALFGFDTSSPMIYHGGPVMQATTLHLLFWQPSSYPAAFEPNYQQNITQFTSDLAHDNGLGTNATATVTQYFDNSSFAGYAVTNTAPLTVTDPLPASDCVDPAGSGNPCLTDAAVTNELDRVIRQQHVTATNRDLFVVFTAPSVVTCDQAGQGRSCSSNAYCGYHSAYRNANLDLVLYANIPYSPSGTGCDVAGTPQGDATGEGAVNTLSHELNETITDPLGNAWYDNVDNGAGEIGDKCLGNWGSPLGTASDGQGYNQVIGGHFWVTQREWSNVDGGCAGSFTPALRPVIHQGGSLDFGSPTTFDATATTDAATTITGYAWSFGDGSVPVTTPTASHTFTATGAYTVTLTVTDTTGQATTRMDVYITKPVHSSLVVATNRRLVNTPFHFAGATNDPNNVPVSDWSWSFGDGQYGSGQKVTHRYSRPGTYTVSFVVTDDLGATSTAHAMVVVAPGTILAIVTPTTRARAVRQGLEISVQVLSPGAIAAEVFLDRATSRRLHLASGVALIGRITGHASHVDETLAGRLHLRPVGPLAHARVLRLTIVATITTGRHVSTATIRLTLR